MFSEVTSGGVAAVISNASSVAGVFAGVLVIALAITLGPRLFRAGLRMLKG